MSGFQRLLNELKLLEQEKYVSIDDGIVTILKDGDSVKDRILETGPQGALLLLDIGTEDEILG